MSDPIKLLRVYLADPPGPDEKFTDTDLVALIETNPDLYAAAADGWRARAGVLAEQNFNATVDGATVEALHRHGRALRTARRRFSLLGVA
jgi:hypothetical protein